MHIDDDYVNREAFYWWFAHHFGWTPQQVDTLTPDRLECFQILENTTKKLEQEAGKK